VSRIDAGTVELVRQAGPDVVSSGDLIQRFSAVWDDGAIATHRQASDALYRVKDSAFEAVARRLRDGVPTTEYDIQQLMAGWFRDEGLISDADPNVSAAENSGNPHYLPTATVHRTIRKDEIVLLDLWGKLDRPGAVYADITWVGYSGARAPERFARAFGAIREARDAGIRVVQDGELLPDPFATLPVQGGGESGLLGLALDPDFASNPFVYVYFTSPSFSREPSSASRYRGSAFSP
jgi:Xaa-Pro aminopeptidase